MGVQNGSSGSGRSERLPEPRSSVGDDDVGGVTDWQIGSGSSGGALAGERDDRLVGVPAGRTSHGRPTQIVQEAERALRVQRLTEVVRTDTHDRRHHLGRRIGQERPLHEPHVRAAVGGEATVEPWLSP